ncbi:hypothetical protein ACHAXT_013136 [Thalassiosira profunda]
MASSQSYADFERDYDAHLSKVRSFLAQSSDNSSPDYATNLSQCEQALQSAKKCIHAMQGLAEIEGDPFKAEEAKRKLEREIGPLEGELRGRKSSGGGGGLAAVFKRGGGQTSTSSDEKYLFGNNRSSYNPPQMGDGDGDLEFGEGSLTAPLTATEQRMRDSEHLLRETQALCAESEQIGASTLETMGRQREQIERSAGLVERALEDTRQARQSMKEMAKRALRNKIFLYCVIALLLLANGAVLVHLWRRKK